MSDMGKFLLDVSSYRGQGRKTMTEPTVETDYIIPLYFLIFIGSLHFYSSPLLIMYTFVG